MEQDKLKELVKIICEQELQKVRQASVNHEISPGFFASYSGIILRLQDRILTAIRTEQVLIE
jgi:hypothetical protein